MWGGDEQPTANQTTNQDRLKELIVLGACQSERKRNILTSSLKNVEIGVKLTKQSGVR